MANPYYQMAFQAGLGLARTLGGVGGKAAADYFAPRTYRGTSYRGTYPAKSYAKTVRRGLVTPVRASRTRPAELNFLDTNFPNVGVNSTGLLTLLNGMAPGTTGSDRIGRRIRICSFQIRLVFQNDTASTFSHCRMILFMDKQANGAAPAITDLLTSASPQAMLNLDNARRFRVLYDKDFVLIGNSTSPSNSVEGKRITYYRKTNIMTVYNSGSAGTIGDIETNSLYCLLIGSAASGTGDSACAGFIRIRYEPLV